MEISDERWKEIEHHITTTNFEGATLVSEVAYVRGQVDQIANDIKDFRNSLPCDTESARIRTLEEKVASRGGESKILNKINVAIIVAAFSVASAVITYYLTHL